MTTIGISKIDSPVTSLVLDAKIKIVPINKAIDALIVFRMYENIGNEALNRLKRLGFCTLVLLSGIINSGGGGCGADEVEVLICS